MKIGAVVDNVHKYSDSLCIDTSEYLVKYLSLSVVSQGSRIPNHIFPRHLIKMHNVALLKCISSLAPILFKLLISFRSPSKIKERHHTHI